MTHPNGGFPPIKYCKKEKKNSQSKERFFAPSKNINIRQLLYNKKTKPMINIDQTNDNIEVLSEL